MNEHERNDLLIRLDERTLDIVGRVTKIEENQKIPLNCQTNTEKIRTLQFLTFTALAATITTVVKTFWGSFTS